MESYLNVLTSQLLGHSTGQHNKHIIEGYRKFQVIWIVLIWEGIAHKFLKRGLHSILEFTSKAIVFQSHWSKSDKNHRKTRKFQSQVWFF